MFSNAFGGSAGTSQNAQGQQAPAAGSGVGQPGNIPPNTAATDVSNPQTPAGTVDASKANAGGPLAEFADLWQPAVTDSSSSAQGFLGQIDPQKVMEAAGKTDFSKVVTAENMQKIQAGGPEAMQAMMEAMNRMAQNVYGQAAIASSKIVEKASAQMEERFQTKMQSEIKRSNVSDSLRQDNPIFNNPAVAPLVSAMEQQFTVKYPNATSQEISKMAKEYISGLGTAFAPAPASAPNSATKNSDTDWSAFLGA